mgnify:FL=1
MLTNDSKATEERVKLMLDISAFHVIFMTLSNFCLTQNYTYTMQVRIYFSRLFSDSKIVRCAPLSLLIKGKNPSLFRSWYVVIYLVCWKLYALYSSLLFVLYSSKSLLDIISILLFMILLEKKKEIVTSLKR